MRNRRFRELARLVVANRAVGAEMVRSAGSRTVTETLRRVGIYRVPSAFSHTGDTPARR